MTELLDDWIGDRRPAVTDKYDRVPLLATKQGRIHVSTISKYVYRFTQPCVYAGECPLNRDPESCKSTDREKASSCPESVSAHPVRRGSITHWLRSDVPPRVVSDRAVVSEKVIDRHYDERSLIEQMEQRRDFLGNV